MTITREQVRQQFPHGTAIADAFKTVFGQIKLTYIKEGEKTIGRPSPEKGLSFTEIELSGDVFKSAVRRGGK